MTKQLTAVLGTGQTHHRAKRQDVSMPGLLREAIDRAMTDAQVEWADIDAVVLGKAPDLFEGRAEASNQTVEQVKASAMAHQSIKQLVDPRDIAARVTSRRWRSSWHRTP